MNIIQEIFIVKESIFVTYFINNYEQFLIKDILADVL